MSTITKKTSLCLQCKESQIVKRGEHTSAICQCPSLSINKRKIVPLIMSNIQTEGFIPHVLKCSFFINEEDFKKFIEGSGFEFAIKLLNEKKINYSKWEQSEIYLWFKQNTAGFNLEETVEKVEQKTEQKIEQKTEQKVEQKTEQKTEQEIKEEIKTPITNEIMNGENNNTNEKET